MENVVKFHKMVLYVKQNKEQGKNYLAMVSDSMPEIYAHRTDQSVTYYF